MQPSLIWLAFLQDRYVLFMITDSFYALFKVNFPESKRHVKPCNLISDPNVKVKLENNLPVLKQKHADGYFSQIQLAMGSSGVPLYDFLGFNFQRLVISSAKFDKLYFQDLLNKLNTFYYDYMLPKFCASGQLF